MPQVVRTTTDVIVNSLYLLGELGVGEQPDAFMLSTGIDLLNELIDSFSSDSIYIPFLTTINFTLTQGKGDYTVSDMEVADIPSDRIVDLTFANYQVPASSGTSLEYPMRIISKAEYYGVVRQNNLQARPGFIFLNKQDQESIITFYPLPDQPYPVTLQVKCMVNKLVPYQSLGELPPNYYGFLKYALADRFAGYYPSGNFTPRMQAILDNYFEDFKNANETDLTIRPSVVMTAPEPFYWANILSY